MNLIFYLLHCGRCGQEKKAGRLHTLWKSLWLWTKQATTNYRIIESLELNGILDSHPVNSLAMNRGKHSISTGFFSFHCNKWKGCQRSTLVRKSPRAGCGVWESPFRQGGCPVQLASILLTNTCCLALTHWENSNISKVEGHRQYEKQLLFWCVAALRGFSSSPECRFLITVCLYKDWIAWQISAICKKKIFPASLWLNRVCHLNARVCSPPYFIPFRFELFLSLLFCCFVCLVWFWFGSILQL